MRSVCLLPALGALAFLLLLPSCDSRIGPPRPIFPDIDIDPAWSPNGKTIAFCHFGITRIDYKSGGAQADFDSAGIWFIEPDGTNKRMFLKNAWAPAWSPDGQWLAVVRSGHVWKIKAGGDSLTQVTFGGSNFDPSWSPDGRWIASTTATCPGSNVTGGCGIQLTRSDGSESYLLTSGRGPDWNPDGSALLFFDWEGGRRGITTYNLKDHTKKMVFDMSGVSTSAYPRYSPSGESIAVGLDFRIWLIDSDGDNARKLSTDCHREQISWSPDGSRIVYATNRGLWVIYTDGTGKRRLTYPPN